MLGRGGGVIPRIVLCELRLSLLSSPATLALHTSSGGHVIQEFLMRATTRTPKRSWAVQFNAFFVASSIYMEHYSRSWRKIWYLLEQICTQIIDLTWLFSIQTQNNVNIFFMCLYKLHIHWPSFFIYITAYTKTAWWIFNPWTQSFFSPLLGGGGGLNPRFFYTIHKRFRMF